MSADPIDAQRGDLDLTRRRITSGPTTRLVIALTLAGALVAAIAFGLILTVRDSSTNSPASANSPGAGGTIAAQSADRREAQLAVAAFAANLNDYSVSDIDDYKARLVPLMTPGFGQSFSLAVDGIVAEVKAAKMTSKGTVVQTAVSSIDEAAATALVVADVRVDSALGDRMRHFRWKVSLVRDSDDGWLVDNFEPVA